MVSIYTNISVNVIVRLPHRRRGDSQGLQFFLALPADKQIRYYGTGWSNHHPSPSNRISKGLNHSMIIWTPICTKLPVNVIVTLPHLQGGDSPDQETLLAPSPDNQRLSTLRQKRFSRSKMKWWAIYTNFPVTVIVRPPQPQSRYSQGQGTFLAPSSDNQTRSHDIKYWNHHPSQLKVAPKGLSPSMINVWDIYTNLTVYARVKLPHSQSGDS